MVARLSVLCDALVVPLGWSMGQENGAGTWKITHIISFVFFAVVLDVFMCLLGYLMCLCWEILYINAHVSKSRVKRSQLLSLASTHQFQLAMLRRTEECIHPDCHQWPQLLHCCQEGWFWQPQLSVSSIYCDHHNEKHRWCLSLIFALVWWVLFSGPKNARRVARVAQQSQIIGM